MGRSVVIPLVEKGESPIATCKFKLCRRGYAAVVGEDPVRSPFPTAGDFTVDYISVDKHDNVRHSQIITSRPLLFSNGTQLRFEMCFGIGSRHPAHWGQNTSWIQNTGVYAPFCVQVGVVTRTFTVIQPNVESEGMHALSYHALVTMLPCSL